MFLCLPEWGDGSKLGVPQLNALQTVEISLFNGILLKRSLWPSSVHFSAQAMCQLAFTFFYS